MYVCVSCASLVLNRNGDKQGKKFLINSAALLTLESVNIQLLCENLLYKFNRCVNISEEIHCAGILQYYLLNGEFTINLYHYK